MDGFHGIHPSLLLLLGPVRGVHYIPGDRLLILGDNRKGIGIVKCEGINDWIDIDEKREN